MQKYCKNCRNEFEARYKFAAYCADCKALGFGGGSHKKKNVAASTSTVDEGLNEDYASIQVADPEEKAAQSIAQRILNGIGIDTNAPIEEKNKAKRRRKEKFFRSMVPLVSNLSVLMVRSGLHDDYKKCAPLENELIATLSPLANMVDRRIDISAAMSEDTEDVLACIKSLGIMTIRIWDAKNQIDDEKLNDRRNNKSESVRTASTDSVVRDMPAYETGQFSHNGTGIVESYASVPPGYNGNQSSGQSVHPGTGELVTANGHQAAGIIQAALARDFEYRSRNGML